MSLVEELAGEVNAASASRVLVAEKWSSAVTVCVFFVCLTAIAVAVLVTQ